MHERSEALLKAHQQHPAPVVVDYVAETANDCQLRARLVVVGLFAGIGGFEEGFRRSGHHTSSLCELDPDARRVLAQRFPGVELIDDIREMSSLPECDVVAAGFPCQDL